MRFNLAVKLEAKPIITRIRDNSSTNNFHSIDFTTIKQSYTRTKPTPPVDPELIDRGVENNKANVPEAAVGVSVVSGRPIDKAVKLITSSIVRERLEKLIRRL
jgi:hypothetical protein